MRSLDAGITYVYNTSIPNKQELHRVGDDIFSICAFILYFDPADRPAVRKSARTDPTPRHHVCRAAAESGHFEVSHFCF